MKYSMLLSSCALLFLLAIGCGPNSLSLDENSQPNNNKVTNIVPDLDTPSDLRAEDEDKPDMKPEDATPDETNKPQDDEGQDQDPATPTDDDTKPADDVKPADDDTKPADDDAKPVDEAKPEMKPAVDAALPVATNTAVIGNVLPTSPAPHPYNYGIPYSYGYGYRYPYYYGYSYPYYNSYYLNYYGCY